MPNIAGSYLLVMILLLQFLLITYSANSGLKDAILWSMKGADAFAWNEHIVFTVERLLLVAIMLTSVFVTPAAALVNAVAFALTFSLPHNQSYYYGRHLIDKSQPWSWSYTSTTSTAKFDLGYKARLLLFVAGIVGVIAFCVFG